MTRDIFPQILTYADVGMSVRCQTDSEEGARLQNIQNYDDDDDDDKYKGDDDDNTCNDDDDDSHLFAKECKCTHCKGKQQKGVSLNKLTQQNHDHDEDRFRF